MVTSRETKRWVIPKGNVMRAVPPHVAAAIEAEEEGGVRGDILPTPLGVFRYRKTRRDGTSLMLDVDVFPLAVTEELSSWKEKGERERRWFSLDDAADAVEEADLADLIRAFDPSEIGNTAPAKQGRFARLKRSLR
jgi:8-oxo-dGTP pyrophosphatase MutT (NUDIX family)